MTRHIQSVSKYILDMLYSAGGKHILCIPELMEVKDSNNLTKEECEGEEKKFKAIVFLKQSDPKRYG